MPPSDRGYPWCECVGVPVVSHGDIFRRRVGETRTPISQARIESDRSGVRMVQLPAPVTRKQEQEQQTADNNGHGHHRHYSHHTGKMISICGTEESNTDVLVIPLAPWCNISAWENLETSCRPNHSIASLLVSSGNKSNRDGTRFHRIQTRKWDGFFYSHHAIARTRCTITTAWCWRIISINVAVALNVRIIADIK